MKYRITHHKDFPKPPRVQGEKCACDKQENHTFHSRWHCCTKKPCIAAVHQPEPKECGCTYIAPNGSGMCEMHRQELREEYGLLKSASWEKSFDKKFTRQSKGEDLGVYRDDWFVKETTKAKDIKSFISKLLEEETQEAYWEGIAVMSKEML